MSLTKIFVPLFVLYILVLNGRNVEATDGSVYHTKIHNGTSAIGHRYLKHTVLFKIKFSVCGGAILTPRVILTAAHCLSHRGSMPKLKDIKEATICAGTYQIDCKTPKAQIRKIKDFMVHKAYTTGGTLGEDLAILVLSKDLKEDGNTVESIKLANRRTPIGTACTLVGWGYKKCDTGEPQISKRVLYTQLTIEAETLCMRYTPMIVVMEHICATDENNTTMTCSGDSGGPLICNGVLVGTHVMGSQILGVPNILTNLSFYRDWIVKMRPELFEIPNTCARSIFTGLNIIIPCLFIFISI